MCLAVLTPSPSWVVPVGVVTADTGSAAAATPGAPACSFNKGRSDPVERHTGREVTIACNRPRRTPPYLVFETSLLLAIDPAAKPLLTGQVASLPGHSSPCCIVAGIKPRPLRPRGPTFPETST